jgi:hypothetical protein
MQIIDDANIFSNEQKKLVLDTAVARLKVYGLESQISSLKLLNGSPASEFSDETRTQIVLYLQTNHFSKPNIKFIIYHEIQHRIDELSPDFGYDKSKKGKLSQRYDPHCRHFSSVLAHLWDIYINGRLHRECLYQTDPNKVIGIKGQFYKRTPSVNRCADIHFLECRGFQASEQVYDKLWNTKEGELSYNQLVNLAKRGLGISNIQTEDSS